MLVEELEGALSINGVRAIKKLDSRSVADSQGVVESPHLGVFVSNPFIGANPVGMPALNHEWTRSDKARHFGVIEGLAKIKFGHFILAAKHVAKPGIDRDVFANPFVEIGRANRKGVTLQQRRHAHGGLATIRQAIKANAPGINEWQLTQPVQDLIVLREDDRED